MARPKVAVVTPGSFPIPSARSSSVERVVEQVIPLVQDRLHCVIFGRSAKHLPSYGTVHGVPCYRVPYGNGARYIQAVIRQLLLLRPDVIQVENRPRYVLSIKKRMPRARVILSLHSTTYISQAVISKKTLRRSLQCTDCIMVNSFFLKTYLVRRFHGLDAKIFVNHLGVNMDQFEPRWSEGGNLKRIEWLHRQGLTGRKIILFVGRLKPQKGIHYLLESMYNIARLEPSAMLVVVGGAFYGSSRKTAYVRKLEQMAKRIPQHVRFVPYVPYDQIARWFNISDVVVVPSSRNEAFGLVNVEAMAAGVPVIAANAGGIREIVQHGVTGYLANPPQLAKELVNCIVPVLRDPALQLRLGLGGVYRTQQYFTWKHTAERWTERIEQMLRI
ncbi:glycosyltransferase family 4 protein [Paenibacillus guangzhouensis]|uniref:glycosyltransferase family 4 protein n=1 Tax=Paenibacillus guangzhouensis TaxID=1473112 RepID=UPI001267363D|nr:glycosyltransferase family 4 protein [Paenibacillus guangzhouensis]